MKVHISIADLSFLEAYYIDITGMAHMKIVEARLEDLTFSEQKVRLGPTVNI